ncbi:MAG: replicative DNA helicase [Planctomycetes bacterium]|nr:replicative DNA helicase [Planctomycetota bacterium]
MAEDALKVVMPQSVDAEMSVLGAVLIDPKMLDDVLSIITADDFFHENHAVLFRVIVDLHARSVPLDAVTLAAELESQGRLAAMGGRPFLGQLLELLPSALHAPHYAKIVREKSLRRQLAEIGDHVRQQALSSSAPVTEILDDAEARVFAIGENENAKGTFHVGELLQSTFDRIEKLSESRGAVTGVDTGYYKLNAMTNGLQRGDLVVIAARPSMGKTTFALNIALNACLAEQKTRALFISLEVSEEQIVQNLVCAQARVEATRINKGTLSERDWAKLSDAASRLGSARFHVDASAALTPMGIRTKARRLARQLGGLDLLIVDYLQMVAPPPAAENRQQEIAQISRGLKELARELKCCVVALSQLNRAVDSREDHRPRLSDLRESGAIEQDADVIMFLYREDYYKGDLTPSNEGSLTEVLVAKHRNGPTGKVELQFFPARLRFENAADGGPEN